MACRCRSSKNLVNHLAIKVQIHSFAPLKQLVMAFTRYKRKDRKNKTVSRQRKQLLKLNSTIITVESPNKDRVVIVED